VDTHGLPVELEVEKQLHISGKFDIENEIGVERFNKLCRESVYKYVDEWTAFSRRMAFWLDYENAYWTPDLRNIQSVWWALSGDVEAGLVYKGFRVAPYCPRCATPLSSHELAMGYRDKFPDPASSCGSGSRRIEDLRSSPDHHALGRCQQRRARGGNDIDYVKVKQATSSSSSRRRAPASRGAVRGRREDERPRPRRPRLRADLRLLGAGERSARSTWCPPTSSPLKTEAASCTPRPSTASTT